LNSDGHGYIPRFKARLTPGGRIRAEAHAGTQAADGTYVALLAGLIRLDLPAANGGAWFEYYRDNVRWRWRHERIRTGARHVAANIDLRTDTRSAAARLCLTVEIRPLAGATGETCRIEAILDQDDGWPIAALIDRTQTGALRAGTTTAVTLERLEPHMTRPAQ
jgi:hypothetical protein